MFCHSLPLLYESFKPYRLAEDLSVAQRARRLDCPYSSRPDTFRYTARYAVPPYVIFHDSTLLEILNQRPATLDEMAQVSGVGQAKLTRYGDEFLNVLKDFIS